MSNQVTLFQNETGATLAPEFKALVAAGELGDDLGEGLRGGGFAVISKKGSKWRIKYKGEETLVTNADGEPAPSLEAVIIKANPFINKQYYKGKWVEGSAAAPDCFSLDGKLPSSQVESPQHHNCAGCPMNVWGSKINEQGKKVKACQDTKKLAVVPLRDIPNIGFNGPMLYRVTSSELGDLGTFADQMKSRGFPYNSVAVRLGFDPNASHPKVTFKAIRPLSGEEAQQVLELYRSDSVARVLSADFTAEAAAEAAPASAATADPDFEQPPVAVAPAPKPAPAAPKAATSGFGSAPAAPAAAKPAVVPSPPGRKPKAAPAPAPVAAPEPTDEEPASEPGQLDNDIANILAGLDKLAG
jgi:hypothetical protein